jgi:hypothetical protein
LHDTDVLWPRRDPRQTAVSLKLAGAGLTRSHQSQRNTLEMKEKEESVEIKDRIPQGLWEESCNAKSSLSLKYFFEKK